METQNESFLRVECFNHIIVAQPVSKCIIWDVDGLKINIFHFNY